MGLQCLETGLLQLNSESILLYGAVGVKSACSYQIQSICCDKPRLFHFRAQLQNCTNFNHCKSHMNQNESWIKHPQSAHWQWHFWVLMIFSSVENQTSLQLHKQRQSKFANKKLFGNVTFPLWKKKGFFPKSNKRPRQTKRPPRVVWKKSTVVFHFISKCQDMEKSKPLKTRWPSPWSLAASHDLEPEKMSCLSWSFAPWPCPRKNTTREFPRISLQFL